MKGSPDPAEVSAAISECLQIVKVKCEVFDEKVLNVLKFLRKLGIRKSLLMPSMFLLFAFTYGKGSK